MEFLSHTVANSDHHHHAHAVASSGRTSAASSNHNCEITPPERTEFCQATTHRLSTVSPTASGVGTRCLELFEQAVALERRMSGSDGGDVKVSLVEIGDLCFATKVNDKQIIFCTKRRPARVPVASGSSIGGGAQDVRKGSESAAGGSVPRQLSAGADRQPQAEVVCSVVAAVGVDSSGELVDSLYLARDGQRWLRVPESDPVDFAASVDGSATAAHWSSTGSAGTLGHADPETAVKLIFDSKSTKGRRTTGRSGSDQFEQFCVKCRVYLLEHFAKFRNNVGVMSRLNGKDFAPSLGLRHSEGGGGGGPGANTSSDRSKKPFSRPFNKNRLQHETAATAGSGAGGTSNVAPATRMPSSTGSSSSPPSAADTNALIRQNNELRHRLQEEANNYRRRLDTYKQAQNNQAALVSRLQAKVLQYKQRCTDLEQLPPAAASCIGGGGSGGRYGGGTGSREPSPGSRHPHHPHHVPSSPPPAGGAICSDGTGPLSLPSVCPAARERARSRSRSQSPCRKYSEGSHDEIRHQLDEERRRCEKLLVENSCLRQQLEESHRTNDALTNDLQKLTSDWESLRDELLSKEDEWKEEEQAFNDYYNNEHTRLLKMWREVVQVRRMFNEMASTTKMELGRMHLELSGTVREVSGACSGVSVNLKQSSKFEEAQQMHIERENMELKSQLSELRLQYEAARQEISQRDQRLQQMGQDLKLLDDRYTQADSQAAQAHRMNDELERLQAALRDIAHAVVQDAETSASADVGCGGIAGEGQHHLHLSQPIVSPGVAPRSPKRSSAGAGSGGLRASQAFAEGTISAVQAALHKYQLAIHDLQVKLQTNNETLKATRKQYDGCEHARDMLSGKVTELTEKLDSANHQLSELYKERDSLQKTLDGLRSDKHTVERGKAELNSIVDSLNTDYEKLQNVNSKLQKMYDALEEEKKMIELELQRVHKDKDIQELNLRAEEERCSRLREETITLREELNKLYLSRDLLEQQRIESDGLLNMLEKQKLELEFELDRVTGERNELHATLEKRTNSNEHQEQEIRQLKSTVVQLDEERSKLRLQSNDQSADLASLKKELISAEQARLDLDSEKLAISERLKCLEMEKDKIEAELSCVARERNDLSNQLATISRKKETVGEEVMRLRQRLEQSNEMNGRLNRSLEELVKESEEKTVTIEGHEKELQRLQEQLASIRSEKESLEAVLFDTNTSLEEAEAKKDALERENQDLLIKQESHKALIARLNKDLENAERRAQDIKIQLTNAAANQEAEFLQKLSSLRTFSEENIKKLNDEKEQIRQTLEKRMQQSLQALESAKDAEIRQLREQYETLQMHLDALNQQHEEVILRAENEKQQALLIAHRDKQAVIEKLELTARELKNELENGDRLKREMAARQEKDRTTIGCLRDEITKMRTKAEEARIRAEEEMNRLEVAAGSLREEKDTLLKDGEELKVQLRLSEDRCDALNHQLQDTQRKLKEAENNTDATRKDLTDTRRTLADSNIERDKYANSNKELRDHVKRVEEQRRQQARTIEDAIAKISSLEETRNGLEQDKVRLQTILKETETNVTKLNQELTNAQTDIQKFQTDTSQKDASEKELQARLVNEGEEKERVLAELHQIKKQMADLEGTLCATRQELGRARCKANQDEHRFHQREQELCGRNEEGRGREKRLEDQKHNLEVCLADATQQIQELKARLGGAEGRVRALDEQLVQLECQKKEVENKLSSIGHTLRRIAGIQMDGSVSLPYRLMSPSRRYSPARGGTGGRSESGDYPPGHGHHGHHHHHHHHGHETRSLSGENVLIDVDPEMVRKGVRSLMQQIAHIERERDDFKVQLCTARKQLQEGSDAQLRLETKINKLQQHVRAVHEDKTNLEARLAQKTSALQSTEETLRQKSDELTALREKAAQLEQSLTSTTEERTHLEERLDKCRQAGARLESDKRHLQDELARTEARASKLDLQRVALEGDIQRLQMAMQEKDCTLRNQQERLENQQRSLTQLEDRCVALKSTVDQLKERLQAAAITETELRGEISGLQRHNADQSHTFALGQDKLKQLQKTLTGSENERRVLAERLDAAQHTINELRRNQQAAQDGTTRLQEQLAECEVQKSTLESQLRLAKWNQETSEQLAATGGNMGGGGVSASGDQELARQLISSQRERNELRNQVEALNDKIRTLERDKRPVGKYDRSEKKSAGGEYDSNRIESTAYNCGLDHAQIEQEGRELRMKVRRLETLLAEKEAELARSRAKLLESPSKASSLGGGSAGVDVERYRSAQVQAERLLDAREQSHRQQVTRLENQIAMLREQLAQEAKRRQQYILRSSRAGREMQQLRQTIGESLRNVAQDPLDTGLLESEARRLDSAVSMSLPPTTGRGGRGEYDRSLSPTFR
ncbi:rootletin [Anopheles funestus]|uniref:rootletin n=1 Tax=Anopheles funestus TaxID=62324 RepID=UPI0020C66062|nr:rootletin [Anopheles funestus]